jgi:hypothetical protein
VEIIRFPTAMDYFLKQTSISHEKRFIADWKNHFFHGKRIIATGNYPIPAAVI